jgi:cytochrome P450
VTVAHRVKEVGGRAVDVLNQKVGTKPRPLSEPPTGSGLKPIMGEPGLPAIGKSMEIMRNGFAAAAKFYDAYGTVAWSNAFGRKIVWAMGPETVQEVLTNKSKAFSQSGWEYFIGPFFNRGLMLLDGQEHLLHRRIMQEAFTRPRIAAYQAHVQRIIDERLPTWQAGEPMLMYPAIKETSLEIAKQVFMGAEPGEDSEELLDAFEDAVRAGTGLIRTGVPVLPTRWNKGLAGRKKLEAYFRELIPAKRASDDEDLFAVLTKIETEDGFRFSDGDVVNHMIFLMMAAHDTSTITATAMTYYLATHPEWQEKARAESQALGDAELTVETLDSLETLDLVFKEAMRLVAPVPAMVRETTEEIDLAGHHVPARTLVVVPPGATHRLSDRWSNEDGFDPLRHAEPRNEQKGHRFQYVPFGGGAHKCIGMVFGGAEVKALLHKMLLRWEFVVPADYELVWDYTSLVVPQDGFPVTLRPL